MKLSNREKAIIVTALTILGLDDKHEVRVTREEVEAISLKFLKDTQFCDCGCEQPIA